MLEHGIMISIHNPLLFYGWYVIIDHRLKHANNEQSTCSVLNFGEELHFRDQNHLRKRCTVQILWTSVFGVALLVLSTKLLFREYNCFWRPLIDLKFVELMHATVYLGWENETIVSFELIHNGPENWGWSTCQMLWLVGMEMSLCVSSLTFCYFKFWWWCN